jgi:UDP-N-acetylmuramate--alanine ligase
MGSDDLFVVEADEYDRSFLALAPDIAVVTNVEADHLDIYGDFDGVRAGFRDFLRRVRPGGRVVACGDDHGTASLLPQLEAPVLTYGLAAGSMLRAVDVEVGDGTTKFSVVEEGRRGGDVTLRGGGAHNVRNALAAAAVARTLHVDWSAIADALAAFRGVGRRFEQIGEAEGVTVIDDYAHHPTEIAAALAAARALFPEARLVVAFQPHLYSRTRDFVDAFGRALAKADVLWVTNVFPAREAPIPGIEGSIVAEAARAAGAAEVHYHAGLESMPEALAAELRAGDVLLTLGAGSIESLGRSVLGTLTGHGHLYGRSARSEPPRPWPHGQPPSFGGHGHA